MKSAKESTNEIKALLESSAVSYELKQTLRLFLETPIEQAVEDARKLEEVFSRHWEAFSEELIRYEVSTLSFDSHSGQGSLNRLLGELGNIRCDETTTRLMKIGTELQLENIHPHVPHLELFAFARALILVSVQQAGVDQGIENAQTVFEAALADLAPKLREISQKGE